MTTDTETASQTTNTACFPTTAPVFVLSADDIPVEKTIGDLRAGDRVRSVLADGTPSYSTIFAVAHRTLNASTRLILLRTADRAFRLSPLHLIPSSPGGCEGKGFSDADWTAARDVAIGDAIWIDSESTVECRPVLSVGRGSEVGFASPLTFSGTIVVDGVVCSAYAYLKDPLKLPRRLTKNGKTPRFLWYFFLNVATLPIKAVYLVSAGLVKLLPASWQQGAWQGVDAVTAGMVQLSFGFDGPWTSTALRVVSQLGVLTVAPVVAIRKAAALFRHQTLKTKVE